MEEIKREKIKIKILTPVHIGWSEAKNLSAKEFFVEDNKVKIIGTNKFIKYIIENNLFDEYVSKLSKNKLITTLKELNIYEKRNDFVKDVISLNRNLSMQEIKNMSNIVTFIKDQDNKIYIPGSSIKGLIVKAIEYNYILKNNSYIWEKINNITKGINHELSKEIERMFISKNKDEDIRKSICVEDTNYLENSNLIIASREDFVVSTKQNDLSKFKEYKEYVKPGTEFECYLKINYDMLKKLGINSFEDIIKSLKKYTQNCLEMDEYIRNEAIKKINLDDTKELEKANMILGSGTGYYSKSIVGSIYTERKELKNFVRNQLDNKFKIHKHRREDILTSPRTLKLSYYNNKYLRVGLCEMIKG